MATVHHFRKTFQFGSKDLTHFFPGHMAKGMNQLKRRLQDVDCIIEVHDARIPLTGRNTLFDSVKQVRPYILALNKVDLADLKHKSIIEDELHSQGVNKIMYTNCKSSSNDTIKNQLIPAVQDLINSGPRFHRQRADDYKLLIIGVPNVGKSSLINALRRIFLKKESKATKVGALAGVTQSLLEKIKISDNPLIYTYDTPGILHPNITDLEAGLKLALCATMKDHLVGVTMIVDYMLYWLNKHSKFKYVHFYNLPRPTDDVLELLAHVSRTNNWTQRVRTTEGHQYVTQPHFNKAAMSVLKDFRQGCLGRINLDEDLITQKINQS